jgi:hypothetical protein
MVEVKGMPLSDKYIRAAGAAAHEQGLAGLIEERLGHDAAAEYRARCTRGMKPIPEDASDEVKYELAFANWMWLSSVAFSYIRERMGDEGIGLMLDRAVEALKRENSSPGLYLLSLVRALSPGRAFEMTAKRLAYECQWLSPYTLDVLSRQRSVMNIQHCKILDYPNHEDSCVVGCQQLYPRWLAEQFKVKMEFQRHGDYGCVATATPLP